VKLCFFDSGMGGLTLLAETMRLLPGAEYVYYADVAAAPLGNKTPAEIVAVLHKAIDFFIQDTPPQAVPPSDRGERPSAKIPLCKRGVGAADGVSAIVLACNTATGYGIGNLRQDLPGLHFFGVEPAVRPAAAAVRDGKILALCTAATARQERFQNLLAAQKCGDDILVCPLWNLARVIEDNYPHDLGAIEREICAALGGYRDADIKGVVLGCTHYILAQDLFQNFFPDAQIFDGNAGTARRIAAVMGADTPSLAPLVPPLLQRGIFTDGNSPLSEGCRVSGGVSVKIFTSARDRRTVKKYHTILETMLQ
jgi:glutamate racemase